MFGGTLAGAALLAAVTGLAACGGDDPPVSAQPEGTGVVTLGDREWKIDVLNCGRDDDGQLFLDAAADGLSSVRVEREVIGGMGAMDEVRVVFEDSHVWRALQQPGDDPLITIDDDGVATVDRTRFRQVTQVNPSEELVGTFEATCPDE